MLLKTIMGTCRYLSTGKLFILFGSINLIMKKTKVDWLFLSVGCVFVNNQRGFHDLKTN